MLYYLVLFLTALTVVAAAIAAESWFARSRDNSVQKNARIRILSGAGGFLSAVTLIAFFAFLAGQFLLPAGSLDFTMMYYVVAATAGGMLLVALINRKPKSDPPHRPLTDILIAFLGMIGGYVGLFVAFLGWILVPLAVDGIISDTRTRFPAWYTDPLDRPTTTQLCEILQLDSEDERCRGEQKVYFAAFLPDLKARFPQGTPRRDVDGEVRAFLKTCDPWVSTESDGVFQPCYYVFGRDSAYALEIVYHDGYPNNHDPSVVPLENSGGFVISVDIPFLDPSDRELRRPLDH